MQKLNSNLVIGNYVIEVLKPDLKITYEELFKFDDLLSDRIGFYNYHTSLTLEQIKEFEDINESILKPDDDGFILTFDESRIMRIKQNLKRRYRIGLPVFIIEEMQYNAKQVNNIE